MSSGYVNAAYSAGEEAEAQVTQAGRPACARTVARTHPLGEGVEGTSGGNPGEGGRYDGREEAISNPDPTTDETVRIDEEMKRLGKNNRDEKEEESQTPDGGWGWVVVIGAALIMMLTAIVGNCFGIIFLDLLVELRTDSTTITWVLNAMLLLWASSGVLVGPLVTELGWRSLARAASTLPVTGFVLSAFAHSATSLLFSLSLLVGLGCGLLSSISIMIVPYYFTRRRGLANSIVMAGDGLGQILGPQIIQFLQEEYGFVGGTLVLAAIFLNFFVGASVFHPVKWHLKPCQRGSQTPKKTVHRSSSCPKLRGCQWKKVTRIAHSIIANFGVLRLPKAVIIAVGVSFVLGGYVNFLNLVPFAMQERGHPTEETALCMSVLALCNLATRVGVSVLSDWPRFNMRLAYMTGIVTITSGIITFTFLEDFTVMTVTMGLVGCGSGICFSLAHLLMVKYMGLAQFQATMGSTQMLTGVAFITIGPIAGYTRDVSGKYAPAMWVLAAFVFASFILWLVMPAALARQNRCPAAHQHLSPPTTTKLQQPQPAINNHHQQPPSHDDHHHHP